MPGITRTDRTVHNIKLGASRIPLPRKIFVRNVAPTIHLAGSTYECQGRRKASNFAQSLLRLLRLHRKIEQEAATRRVDHDEASRVIPYSALLRPRFVNRAKGPPRKSFS